MGSADLVAQLGASSGRAWSTADVGLPASGAPTRIKDLTLITYFDSGDAARLAWRVALPRRSTSNSTPFQQKPSEGIRSGEPMAAKFTELWETASYHAKLQLWMLFLDRSGNSCAYVDQGSLRKSVTEVRVQTKLNQPHHNDLACISEVESLICRVGYTEPFEPLSTAGCEEG